MPTHHSQALYYFIRRYVTQRRLTNEPSTNLLVKFSYIFLPRWNWKMKLIHKHFTIDILFQR
jgi:hypothetical protein